MLKEETLEVVEVFNSLQGEGSSIGHPAVFLRLRRCNLSCSWCDQRETWDKNDPGYSIFRVSSLREVREEVLSYNPSLVIVTGGEPVIWQRNLRILVDSLPSNVGIEIETNGTIIPKDLSLTRAHFNVSPKLPSSGNQGLKTINPEALHYFSDLARLKRAIFKFVISQPSDFLQVSCLVKEYDLSPVYVMPEGVSPEEINSKLSWMWDLSIERGFRVSTRLHVQAFGDKKGV